MTKQVNILHQRSLESMIRQHEAGRLGHAYIVHGPSGVGKLAFVKAVAQHLLGVSEDSDVLDHPDMAYCTLLDDKKSVSIEQIRQLTADAQQTTHQGRARVLVINHADTMTLSAANALLKTLEEPGGHNVFFLITSHEGRLPATIRSRCQLLKLHPPAFHDSHQWLRDQIDDVSSETVNQLLYFAFSKPTAALRIYENDLLSRYQELWQATQSYFKAPQASPWPLIALQAPEVLLSCLQLYVLSQSRGDLGLVYPIQAAWQAITDAMATMVNQPGINADLLCFLLLDRLSKLFHKAVRHAVS